MNHLDLPPVLNQNDLSTPVGSPLQNDEIMIEPTVEEKYRAKMNRAQQLLFDSQREYTCKVLEDTEKQVNYWKNLYYDSQENLSRTKRELDGSSVQGEVKVLRAKNSQYEAEIADLRHQLNNRNLQHSDILKQSEKTVSQLRTQLAFTKAELENLSQTKFVVTRPTAPQQSEFGEFENPNKKRKTM